MATGCIIANLSSCTCLALMILSKNTPSNTSIIICKIHDHGVHMAWLLPKYSPAFTNTRNNTREFGSEDRHHVYFHEIKKKRL